MNTVLQHGITFFKLFANQKWGVGAEYQKDIDVPFEEKLTNNESVKEKLFLWHRFYGMVTASTIENGFEIGHAIDHCIDKNSDDRSSLPAISHVGIYMQGFDGVETFKIYKFDEHHHMHWVKKNPVAEDDPRNIGK